MDDAVWTNEDVITNADGPKNTREGTNLHATSDGWMALARDVSGNAARADGYSAEHVTIVADLACFANHRSITVVEHKTAPDPCSNMDLCAGEQFATAGYKR